MKILLLFLLLLVPSISTAQAIYDLSCESVARIRIVRINDTYWNVESYQGHFHVVDFELKPDAAKVYWKLLKAARTFHIPRKVQDMNIEKLSITANSGPLQNDAPELTGFADHGITITIIREQDAFDAARSVCPALVPRKVLLDGQWE